MQRRTAGDGDAGAGDEMQAVESHGLTVLAELSGHAGRAAAGAGGRVAGAAVLAAAAQAAVPPEGAGRAGWGERGRRGQRPPRSTRGGDARGSSPASLTLVAEDAGPARGAVAAGPLRVAGAAVPAVLARQAAVGAERALQADCNERSRG